MKLYDIKTKYVNEKCSIKIGKYAMRSVFSIHRKTIQLFDHYGEPMMTASVNLHHVPIDIDMREDNDRMTFIKNYSENEGILSELVRHGIIRDTGKATVLNAYGDVAHYVEVLID